MTESTLNILAPSHSGTWKGVFITRDRETGLPSFADPHNVPQVILDALTDTDLAHLETLKKEE